MSDQKPTHIPAEGEGTPTLPTDTDVASKKTAKPSDDEGELPPFDPQMGAAVEQG